MRLVVRLQSQSISHRKSKPPSVLCAWFGLGAMPAIRCYQGVSGRDSDNAALVSVSRVLRQTQASIERASMLVCRQIDAIDPEWTSAPLRSTRVAGHSPDADDLRLSLPPTQFRRLTRFPLNLLGGDVSTSNFLTDLN